MNLPSSSSSLPGCDDASFAELARLVRDSAGISLKPGKQALVLSRLAKRMREVGARDLAGFLRHLEAHYEEEIEGVINVLSTNVTNFFRHPEHFELLARRIREARAGGERRFRYWSAACSTGEEPYSIAMTALEAAGNGGDVRVLATDISTRVLRVAMKGEYLAAELETVPRAMSRFVAEVPERRTARRVAEPVRRAVTFRHYNLSARPLPLEDGKLDAVFCRNVMIYFDRDLRQRLVSQAERLLRPGGLFFVGQSESLTGLHHRLRAVEPSVYERP